jgi:hypothetical protein
MFPSIIFFLLGRLVEGNLKFPGVRLIHDYEARFSEAAEAIASEDVG